MGGDGESMPGRCFERCRQQPQRTVAPNASAWEMRRSRFSVRAVRRHHSSDLVACSSSSLHAAWPLVT